LGAFGFGGRHNYGVGEESQSGVSLWGEKKGVE